jgi:hypothetical protein
MKRTLLVATICLVLAGCGSYSENRIAPLSSPPKTIALGEFKGNDAGIAQLFADTVAIQLTIGGFKIVTEQNQADVIVTGTVSYNCSELGNINDWMISVKRNEQFLRTIEFHGCCGLSGCGVPKEVIPELSRRLVKSLHAND